METLSNRLKNLRIEKGEMQKEVAMHLNITTSAYGFYEQGKRMPTPEILSKLADYFDVSVDYLLGKTNIKQTKYINQNNDKDIKKAITSTLEQLENAHDGLMFDGEILDDETRELLIISLERSMKLAKQLKNTNK